MDIDTPMTNGAGAAKRKARASVNGKSLKEPSSDEDDQPIVNQFY